MLNPLYVLVVTSAVSQFVYLIVQFTLLLYALHLQVSATTAGLLVSLFGLGPALIAVTIGKLIDRKGARPPMLLALAGQVAGAAIPFLWRDLPALFVTAALSGTSFVIFRIASQQSAGRTGRPEDRAANYGLMGLGYSSSSIAAPLCAGFAIEHYGHPATFLAATLLAFVPLAVVGCNLMRLQRPAAEGAPAAARSSVFSLLKKPELRRIVIVTVLINGAWDMFTFLIPLYGSQLALGASQIGMLSGIFAGGALFVRAITAQVLRWFSPWQLLILSLAVTGACFTAYPQISWTPALLAIAFIAGMGIGVALPITMALSFDATPAERTGELIGLRLSLSMASTATLPLLGGALGAAFGLALVYWTEGLALLAAAATTRRQWRHRSGRA